MTFLIILFIFGLTNLSVAMEPASLPTPSLLVELGNLQQTIELLQRHNDEQAKFFLITLLPRLQTKQLEELQSNLTTSIASLENDRSSLQVALEKIKAAHAQVAAAQNVTNSTPKAKPHRHASHKKTPPTEKWPLHHYIPNAPKRARVPKTPPKEKWVLHYYNPNAPKRARVPSSPNTASAHPEESEYSQ